MDQTNNPENQQGQQVVPPTDIQVPSEGTSNDTKTIVTVLLLMFVFPIGFIVMWMWPRWPKWVKILVSIPIIFAIFAIVMAMVLAASNSTEQIQIAECVRDCREEGGGDECVQQCLPTPR